MAHLLGAEALALTYPNRRVLDGVSLGLDEGDRIGVVGRNGEGKSSLLKLLARQIEPDAGRVTWRRGLDVGLLPQGDTLIDTLTVGQSIVGDAAEHEWASDPATRDVVNGLVSDLSWTTQVGELSGGQRRRVSLAALLVGKHDVVLLDEPTNHLDVEGITWLAHHFAHRWAATTGALVVVTHDRWFLDEVSRTTWEVHDGVVEPFDGGYAAYILQRVERDRAAAVMETKRRNLMRKELAWLGRGAPARSTKPKFRVAEANALIANEPPPRDVLELRRVASARLGKDVVDFDNVSFRYEKSANGGTSGTLGQENDRPDIQGSGDLSTNPSGHVAGASSLDTGIGGDTDLNVFLDLGEDRSTASAPSICVDVFPPPTSSSSVTPDPSAPAPRILDGPCDTPGPWVIRDLTWSIGPGDRIGLLGANGSGKSTLIGLMTGALTPTSGRVRRGKTAQIAWLTQRGEGLSDGTASGDSEAASLMESIADKRVRDVIADLRATYATGVHRGPAWDGRGFDIGGRELSPAQILERLGFTAAHLSTPVRDLSGGQRRRLQLALTLLEGPNVLILDEPSNDLDTDMLVALEDLLDTWPGTLIVVSHDRYLMERATDQQYAIIDGRLRHVPGGVDEYLSLAQAAERVGMGAMGGRASAGAMGGRASAAAMDRDGVAGRRTSVTKGSVSQGGAATGPLSQGRAAPTSDSTGGLSGSSGHPPAPASGSAETRSPLSSAELRALRKQQAAAERAMEKLTDEVAAIHAAIAAHDPSDYVGLSTLVSQAGDLEAQLRAAEDRWLELADHLPA